jgi:hypothetical protein
MYSFNRITAGSLKCVNLTQKGLGIYSTTPTTKGGGLCPQQIQETLRV